MLDSNLDIIICANRRGNVYVADIEEINAKCLMVKNDKSFLWHRRLGHVNPKLIKRIARKDLVIGLPKINFSEEMFCDTCCQGKQTRA